MSLIPRLRQVLLIYTPLALGPRALGVDVNKIHYSHGITIKCNMSRKFKAIKPFYVST